MLACHEHANEHVNACEIQVSPCQAGTYADEAGDCADCQPGFYCPGTGRAMRCPQNSTTVTIGRSPSDCICDAGYYFVAVNGSVDTNCRPCARKTYKPNIGNGECPLTCPTNADSEPAATSLDDCFCDAAFHASLDASTGQLVRCMPCNFQGLDCRGGFENATFDENGTASARVHAQPIALWPARN